MAFKALLQSLSIEDCELLIELLVIGCVRIDGTLEGYLGLNLRVYISYGPVLKDQSSIVITHGLGLCVQLVSLTLQDLGCRNSPLLGILFQLLFLLLQLEQILAIVKDSFQELVA